MVRISTIRTPQNTSFATSSRCTVYQGAIGVMDSSTYVDDTYLGSGDVTTIVSGSIIYPGQAITAVWASAFVGDQALVTVYGRVYDNLVELQREQISVPGARFAGGSGNGMIWEFACNASDTPSTFATPPSFITPSDAPIEVVAVQLGTTTTATAGSRFFGLVATATVVGVTATLCNSWNNTAVAASTITGYYWNQGITASTVATGNRLQTPMPAKLILPPISTVAIVYSGPDTADAWFNYRVSYRRFTSLTKVSYT